MLPRLLRRSVLRTSLAVRAASVLGRALPAAPARFASSSPAYVPALVLTFDPLCIAADMLTCCVQRFEGLQ
jgi:hypothetical protein